VAEVLWEFSGTISTDQNDNLGIYRAKRSLTFTGFDIRARGAPAGSVTTVIFRKNGANVVTVSLPAGSTYVDVAGNIALVNGDDMDIQVTALGSTSPGTTFVIRARES
jgi:hypothetical protein